MFRVDATVDWEFVGVEEFDFGTESFDDAGRFFGEQAAVGAFAEGAVEEEDAGGMGEGFGHNFVCCVFVSDGDGVGDCEMFFGSLLVWSRFGWVACATELGDLILNPLLVMGRKPSPKTPSLID